MQGNQILSVIYLKTICPPKNWVVCQVAVFFDKKLLNMTRCKDQEMKAEFLKAGKHSSFEIKAKRLISILQKTILILVYVKFSKIQFSFLCTFIVNVVINFQKLLT